MNINQIKEISTIVIINIGRDDVVLVHPKSMVRPGFMSDSMHLVYVDNEEKANNDNQIQIPTQSGRKNFYLAPVGLVEHEILRKVSMKYKLHSICFADDWSTRYFENGGVITSKMGGEGIIYKEYV